MVRKEKIVDRFIRQRLSRTKRVVHGGRAQNAQLPRFLNRPTKDWDIFAKNPKKAAENMEKFLDKRFREDKFSVKKGFTKRLKVHKVVSNKTGEGVIDYSIPDRVVKTIAKRRIRFASLKDQKEKAISTLKEKLAPFRRVKDLDLLKRIKKFEKLRGKKV